MNHSHNDTVRPLCIVIGVGLALAALAWMIVPLFFVRGT